MKKMTKESLQKTGLFLSSLFILLGILWSKEALLGALLCNALVLAYPRVFTPIARIGGSAVGWTGRIVSRIVFLCVYIVVVWPVGILQRLSGRDPMAQYSWKTQKTMFKERNYTATKEDFERLF